MASALAVRPSCLAFAMVIPPVHMERALQLLTLESS